MYLLKLYLALADDAARKPTNAPGAAPAAVVVTTTLPAHAYKLLITYADHLPPSKVTSSRYNSAVLRSYHRCWRCSRRTIPCISSQNIW
jgi:hypothetical protein